jgi:putative DNA primase/helicase
MPARGSDIDFAALMGDVARWILGEPNRVLSSERELRFGGKGALAVNLNNGTWYDFSSGEGGGVLDLIRRERPEIDPMAWLRQEGFVEEAREEEVPLADPEAYGEIGNEIGAAEEELSGPTMEMEQAASPSAPPDSDTSEVPASPPKITNTFYYTYQDEEGILRYQIIRTEYSDGSKRLQQRRPSGAPELDEWIWDIQGIRRLLYRLPELIASAERDAFAQNNEEGGDAPTIFIPEGEKKVELLRSWGLIATCNSGGGMPGRWPDDKALDEVFRDRRVVILPDNDPVSRNSRGEIRYGDDNYPIKTGQDHAERIARRLRGIAREIRVVELPGLPEKGDIIDWVAGGGNRAILEEEVAKAPLWAPRPPINLPKRTGSKRVARNNTPFSDDALATELVAIHENSLRYVGAWSKWLYWDGTVWREDDTGSSGHKALLVCRAASERAKAAPKSGALPRALASARTRGAVLNLASTNPALAATVDQWNADDWILATPGGIVDLRTGDLRKADPLDYCTKITAVTPADSNEDLEMICPTWMKFLRTVTGGDSELIAYLQRMAGYALTGNTREECLFFVFGQGGNGKSKYIEAISGCLGTYHVTAAMDTFIETRHEQHTTALAMLMGARLVTSVETDEGRRWAESKIKQATGGDKITARRMREDNFSFQPKFKLVIVGNHKPTLRSVDDAVRRRMNIVPFTVKISSEERDMQIGEKLRAEWAGILRWMIKGCLEWQRIGLAAPGRVTETTQKYLDNEDAWKIWFGECVQKKPMLEVVSTEGVIKAPKEVIIAESVLFQSWEQWAIRSGEYVGPIKRFTNKMEAEGYTVEIMIKDSRNVRAYKGLSLAQVVENNMKETKREEVGREFYDRGESGSKGDGLPF